MTITDNRNPGDDGTGWSGVTPAQKNWSAGRMYEDIRTGRPLGPAASALFNANQVAETLGSGHWSRRKHGGDGSNGG